MPWGRRKGQQLAMLPGAMPDPNLTGTKQYRGVPNADDRRERDRDEPDGNRLAGKPLLGRSNGEDQERHDKRRENSLTQPLDAP
jgi:hypothetical protein